MTFPHFCCVFSTLFLHFSTISAFSTFSHSFVPRCLLDMPAYHHVLKDQNRVYLKRNISKQFTSFPCEFGWFSWNLGLHSWIYTWIGGDLHDCHFCLVSKRRLDGVFHPEPAARSFSFGAHPFAWREEELSLNKQRFTEHRINLNTGPNTRPRRLRILRGWFATIVCAGHESESESPQDFTKIAGEKVQRPHPNWCKLLIYVDLFEAAWPVHCHPSS